MRTSIRAASDNRPAPPRPAAPMTLPGAPGCARGTSPAPGMCDRWIGPLSHITDTYDQYVDVGGTRRWLTLAAGTIALTAGCTFQYGLAYLIPALRADGLSLEQAGILVACPTVGLLLTLVAWGAAADRFGERLVLASGLAVAGVILLAATGVHTTVALGACLVAAGAARSRPPPSCR